MSRSMRSALALGAVLALGGLTYGVLAGSVWVAEDLPTVRWAAAHRSRVLTTLMLVVSASGGPSATSAYAVVVAGACLIRRRIAMAIAVAAIILGGNAMNAAFKALVQRARPVLEDPLAVLPSYSFPSGHAAASMVFGGLLVMWVLRRDARDWTHGLAIGTILVWIIAVGVSRVYLGAHFPTDVAGGFLEGFAWLMACTLVLDRERANLGLLPSR
ncbi:MAG: phosphatase PAP2 family protein [Casimicrobiaceae bacterium]